MVVVGLTGWRAVSRCLDSAQVAERAFFGISALLFAASAAATVHWCASMSAMGKLPMPGAWMMSMTWRRMPGQTWPGAAASFLGMWVAMMVAMMLPSLMPTLWRYRRTLDGTREARAGLLTVLVGIGYFSVWTLLGMAAFPVGAALTSLALQLPALARGVPIAIGVVTLVAGIVQCTEWKAYHLARWRVSPGCGRPLPPDAAAAWRLGAHLGIHCTCCCANFTAILLVIGLTDLRAMAVATAAINLERLIPAAERAAQGIGIVVIGGGLLLVARALAVQG